MTISTSDGLFDLAKPESRAVFLSDILDMSSREKILRLPVNFDDEETVRLVESWPVSLHAHGLRISTGSVVPFRATEFIDKSGDVPTSHVPLFWLNHVKKMQVTGHWVCINLSTLKIQTPLEGG